MEFASSSPKTTQAFATLLAKELLQTELRHPRALVVALSGTLGSGKTTFVQGFARGLGVRKRITSPTFIIFRGYRIRSTRYHRLFHVDAYRLSCVRELDPLDLKGVIADPKNIVLVEWPTNIRRALPASTLWIRLQHGRKPNERVLRLT